MGEESASAGDSPQENILDENPESSDFGNSGSADISESAGSLEGELQLLESLQRLKADFDNYKRRTASQQKDISLIAEATLIEQMMPAIDACESSLKFESEEAKPIVDIFFKQLTDAGLEKISPAEGEAFNPELHEAIGRKEREGAEAAETREESASSVFEVVRTGYIWKGRLIRPALVTVK